MDAATIARARAILLGHQRPRRLLLTGVLTLLVLVSVAFLFGATVGLYAFRGWAVIVPVVAVGAGLATSGLLPTIAALWLIGFWGNVFPPLVGYLTGAWTGTGRYTTPRMAGFAYGSARAELQGGLSSSVTEAVVLAIIIGTIGYALGAVLAWIARVSKAHIHR